MEYQVCESGLPANGNRLHTCVEGRFITLFRHNNRLSAIDSVCHHAGGPLTLGPLQDIEELGMTGTRPLTHLLARHYPTHLLTRLVHSHPHSLIHSRIHSFIHSLIHLFIHSSFVLFILTR